MDIFSEVAAAEADLKILNMLRKFSIAADQILKEKGQGSYHLIVLDSESKSVNIKPYPVHRLDEAAKDYSEVEKRAQNGEKIEAVLVSAGPIEALKRAYPNYFLDTHGFIAHVESIITSAAKANRKLKSAPRSD